MNTQRGFSLIELTLATVVLGVALGVAVGEEKLTGSSPRQAAVTRTMQLVGEHVSRLDGVPAADLADTLRQPVSKVAGLKVSGTEGDYVVQEGALRGSRVQVELLDEATGSELLGEPSDLDGDGRVGEAGLGRSKSDASAYSSAPVRIRVSTPTGSEEWMLVLE